MTRAGGIIILIGLAALLPTSAAAMDDAAAPTAAPAAAQASPGEPANTHAAGLDFFMSTDADHTDIYRAGLNLDIGHRDWDRYWGVAVEKSWYRPTGGKTTSRDRVYLRYADKSDSWAWNGRIGTDGDTVLGSADIHNNARFRQEYFIERDIVETRMGLDRGLYYTFAGAAIDLPADDRNVLTVVAGAQAFSGKNMRLHLRANYVHVLKSDWGLSAQVRTRYFYSTHPREYDYYSPRWYLQAVPVLQLRRYSGGWRYMIAGGIGAQRDATSGWQPSRYLAAQVSSPSFGRNWFLKANAEYSNTSLTSGVYDYLQLSLSLTRAF